MKKFLITSLVTSLCIAANAATLVLPNPLPEGLQQGTFYSTFYYNYVHGGDSSYASAGPVNNPGMYGLAGTIDTINGFLNDSDTYGYLLYLKLTCKNKKNIVYNLDNNALTAPGQIFINPPADCN